MNIPHIFIYLSEYVQEQKKLTFLVGLYALQIICQYGVFFCVQNCKMKDNIVYSLLGGY